MLVLTRKIDELIRIRVPPSTFEQVIEVCVCEIMPSSAREFHRAKIGTHANPEVRINREEVDDKIAAEKIAADAARLAG